MARICPNDKTSKRQIYFCGPQLSTCSDSKKRHIQIPQFHSNVSSHLCKCNKCKDLQVTYIQVSMYTHTYVSHRITQALYTLWFYSTDCFPDFLSRRKCVYFYSVSLESIHALHRFIFGGHSLYVKEC